MTGRGYVWGDTHIARRDADGEGSRWRAPDCGVPFGNSAEEQYNVSRRPGVWGGSAVILGSSIPVFMVEDLYREEGKVEDVLEAYPWLTRAEVLRALAYADSFSGDVLEDRNRHEQAIRDALEK